MRLINEKYGYWLVNNLKFYKKIDALLYASKNNSSVNFYYHNDVWEYYTSTINRDLLGKQNLNQLYKERAQQLRDTYNYLILYYSGGADSHNILRTFLDNNIKLDEICIKWPKFLRDGKLYTPNIKDTSANNYSSEWDFAIKPILDYLNQYHSDVKITFVDYSENINNKSIERALEKSNNYGGGSMLYTSCYSETANIKQNIGHIYGIDKPLLTISENEIKMIFVDLTVGIASPPEHDPTSVEFFYWSPDMPILAIEMAYQMSEFYVNPEYRKYLWDTNWQTNKNDIGEFQRNLAIKSCYTNWDNRFQTKKIDRALLGDDKWFWFKYFKGYECFHENFKSIISGVSENHLLSKKAVQACYTRGFFIRKI